MIKLTTFTSDYSESDYLPLSFRFILSHLFLFLLSALLFWLKEIHLTFLSLFFLAVLGLHCCTCTFI